MSHILLVSANITVDPFPVYPLGMAVVAAGLTARGHTVEQFDFLVAGGAEEAFSERIRTCRPDFIGISIRNLDSCDSLSDADYTVTLRRLVQVARTITKVPIILGGSGFSILPEEMLAYSGADFGVIGEGEVLVAELIEALNQGREVPRILLRSSAPLSGRDIASPLFDPELVAFYKDRSGFLNLQTKRGCPFHCVYCNYPVLEGPHFRPRDPRAVVEDLARAKSRFESIRFFFADSVFNDPSGHHMEIVEEILHQNLGLEWTCYIRPKGINREGLRLMKRAGLRAAELGTDAATDTTLEGLAKGFTFADVVRTNEAFIAEELPCAHFVIFGAPRETEATIQEGLANLERLRHTVVFAFSGIRIFPNTPIQKMALDQGLLAPKNSLRAPTFYYAPGLDPNRLNTTLEAGFRGRRNRFFPPERGRERMEVLQGLGFRGQIWDTLIRFPKKPSPGTESPMRLNPLPLLHLPSQRLCERKVGEKEGQTPGLTHPSPCSQHQKPPRPLSLEHLPFGDEEDSGS